MKNKLLYLFWLGFVMALTPSSGLSVEVGDKAPVFEAESTMGTIRLNDYLGKKNVLLAFYYKNFTGG